MSLQHVIEYFGKCTKEDEKEDKVLQEIYRRNEQRKKVLEMIKDEPLTENEELFLR